MRRWLVPVLAALASCASPPETPAVPPSAAAADSEAGVPLAQGWSPADRQQFVSTPQGSYLMPLAWFTALRRLDRDEAFAADQLGRYGYLPTPAQPGGASPLPVGFVRDGTDAEPHLGMTCAACHTGQLRYRGQAWRIDGGRADADFQAFLTDLGAASSATLADPARFDAFAGRVLGPDAAPAHRERLRSDLAGWTGRYTAFMAASLPDQPWGPGRLDAFGMIFNRVLGLDLAQLHPAYPANLQKADAPTRYPFIWDAPRQDRTQWTGAAPNGTYLRGLARNTGEVFGVFGRFDPVGLPARQVLYRNAVNLPGLQAIEEKVVALRAPPWPREAFGLDQARADRGAEVFRAECSACHGLRPSELVRNAWHTPVEDVGTDPRTFVNAQRTGSPVVLTGTQRPPVVGERLGDPAPRLLILSNAVVGSLLHGVLQQDPGIRRGIRMDFAEERLPLLGASRTPAAAVANATQDLYKLPRQRSGAAYEARVLTGIWAVGPYLHNGSVPSLWELLKPARDRMTRFAVGHREFDPVHVGLETAPAPGRAVFVVDPAAGNGNAGHEYGATLPEADRWALIEYLKTL